MPSRFPLLLALIVLAGCRTYGGYGSEEATYVQIEKAVDWATQERARLSNDEMALREASERLPFLEDFAPRLELLSARLTADMDAWSKLAGGIDASAPYRDLNQALGAMIAERQRYEDQYRRLADDVAAVLDGSRVGPPPEARYQVAPAFYSRIASRFEARRIRDLVAVAE